MNPIKPLALATLLALGGGVATTVPAAAQKSVEQTLSDANKEGRIWASCAESLSESVRVRHQSQRRNRDAERHRRRIDRQGTRRTSRTRRQRHQESRQQRDGRSDWAPKTRPTGERTFGQTAEDATITATVKSKLLWSEHTDGLDINVDTMSGVVTLRGKVPSAEGKDLAGRYAANTSGVRKVNNDLSVVSDAKRSGATSEQPMTDTWVTAKVKSSLTLSRPLMDDDIDVKTTNGVVTLSGQVESTQEKSLAIEIADSIRGAKKVDAGGLKTRR